MCEGTPYGTILHPRKKVSGPDGYRVRSDGEIKAPPSVGVHVVGFVGEFAPAKNLACWQDSQKIPQFSHFLRRRSED